MVTEPVFLDRGDWIPPPRDWKPDGGGHDVSNGLLLRRDVHRLFDLGYVTVTPEHRFEVSRRLRDEWHSEKRFLG